MRAIYAQYFLILVVSLLLVGCTPIIPATTPPQLEHTPGAFVALDAETFDGGFFRVNYPDGWRVIKLSIAADPLQVVFASPDDSMTILIHEGDYPIPEGTPDPNIHERIETLEISENYSLTIIGQAPIDNAAAFDDIFNRVFESIVLTE